MNNVIKILVVEDSEIDAFLIESIIHHHTPDVEIVHQRNGKEALDYLAVADVMPDMVILDLNMPVMDGFRFLDIAKDDETLRNLPIFVLSSSDHHYDLQQTHCHEINGYYLKPLEIAHFQTMLESLAIKV